MTILLIATVASAAVGLTAALTWALTNRGGSIGASPAYEINEITRVIVIVAMYLTIIGTAALIIIPALGIAPTP